MFEDAPAGRAAEALLSEPAAADLATRRSAWLSYAPPTLGEEEIEEVVAALRSDWITTGPRVRRFEERFAARLGAPEAVALSSCTAGLHTALSVSGIGPGDTVITTPLTFAGTSNAIEHVGARPVFVDIEPDTLTLDPQRVVEALERANGAGRTRALLPVHYAGHACDVLALDEIAADRDLVVVEDAAHALPTTAPDGPIGAHAGRRARTLTSFSFYANKNITTGEGGMLTGPADELRAARVFSHHGLSRDGWQRAGSRRPWQYEVVAAGHKFNMTDVAAAIGLRQLEKLGDFHARRREIAALYDAGLADLDAVELPVERPGHRHAWHLYVIRLRLDCLSIDRDRFLDELALRNIGTSVHYLPLPLHPHHRPNHPGGLADLPVTAAVFPRLVSLPIYPRMTDADVESVIAAVQDVSERFGR